ALDAPGHGGPEDAERQGSRELRKRERVAAAGEEAPEHDFHQAEAGEDQSRDEQRGAILPARDPETRQQQGQQQERERARGESERREQREPPVPPSLQRPHREEREGRAERERERRGEDDPGPDE